MSPPSAMTGSSAGIARWRSEHEPGFPVRRGSGQDLRRRHRPRWRRPVDGPRRVRLAAGPLGLRQDHAAADRGRADAARPGPRRARRAGHHPAAAAPARRQRRVPELCAVSASERGGERRLRPEGARRAISRDRAGRGALSRPRPDGRLCRPLDQGAVGWAAAARCGRTRARRRAQAAVARRALLCARPQAARDHADRPQAPAARGRHHRDLCHA